MRTEHTPFPELTDRLSRLATGRAESLFAADLAAQGGALREALAGARVLVVGAAGSIGSSTVYQLLAHGPREMALVDPAENNLVELLRGLRSRAATADAPVQLVPIDFGSPAMARFLAQAAPFDWVLNFAAVKHVRSERDEISLLQMLDTNLLKADRFLGRLRAHGHGRRGTFFVSSDKAANPANLMGATKRVMERMLHWHGSAGAAGATLLGERSGDPLPRVTTARFANVAFSDGSLPHGYLQRLARRQPLSGPSDVRRFLVSLEEAGQLCLLAALLGPTRHALVPRLDPNKHQVGFAQLAELALREHGFAPRWCASAEEARALPCGENGLWPCHFAASDTMGEKDAEEFVAEGETALELGFEALLGVRDALDHEALRAAFPRMQAWLERPEAPFGKDDLVNLLGELVPTLHHVASEHSLDRKM